jgi:hypothetical protein
MRGCCMARLALAGVAATFIAGAQVRLSGRVVDEIGAPVGGARVRAVQDGAAPLVTSTAPSGDFHLSLLHAGPVLLSVEQSGYFQLKDRSVDVGPDGAEVTLVLNPQRDLFQSVTVGEPPSPVDPAETQRQDHLSGADINDVPYPATQSLRNAMKLMPGVVQDATGTLHFHGGTESQTQYTLNGFDISDPIDGRYTTRLALEGVRSLDLLSSREPPRLGRGSAGVMAIRTDSGTDQFHFTATNFVPGVDFHGGARMGSWTPRAAFSGPLRKGRAWFSDSIYGEYSGGYIPGLPKGQDSNRSTAAGNLLHVQVNLTPANLLFADLLTNFDHQDHAGLGVLDPISTTAAWGTSQWLASVRDLHTWSGGSLLEIGFAWHRVQRNRVPAGTGMYILSPEGRSGYYFVNSHEHGRRAQWFGNFTPRAFAWAGSHRFEFGGEVQRLGYSAEMRRTGFEVIGLSGLPVSVTTFQGGGDFEQPNTVAALSFNDHYQPLRRVTLDLGVRMDSDTLVGASMVSPRAAMAWAPFEDARTKITAGYAETRDATNLAFFSRPLDQQSVTTLYSSGGVPETPLLTTFVMGRDLKLPRSRNWSGSVERDFGRRLSARLEWLRRRARDGFVYAAGETGEPAVLGTLALRYGFGGTYTLSNRRRDLYDEVALTVRQSLGEQYGWMASYVRSRAVSNAVLDISVDQPLQVQNDFGHVPWDTPNRLLAWGYFPTPWKNWTVASLLDWRSGFPFAVTTDSGVVVGRVDAHRFPATFDLNLHIERRFTFGGYRFALRAGCNNLTNSRNSTAVNNVIGSGNYLEFYGDEGRHYVLRIRIFGRAKP